MKIVFLGFASSYTPGMTYQDNYLCNQVLADGHEVTYLANTEEFINGKIEEVGEEDVFFPNGLHLIRLRNVFILSKVVTKKLRLYKGVYSILEKEKPDVIFCHNTQYGPIRDVAKYKKKHPNVKFYADTHTASYNSATNWLSLHILHRVYYKWLLQSAMPQLDKYYYIGESERSFAIKNYGVPESLMEFFPLGGLVLSDEEYQKNRQEIRNELVISDDMRLYGHAGKLTSLKKTEDLLLAFSSVPDKNARLIIMGSIPDDRKDVLLPMIQADSRVNYLGWISGDSLQRYLCACDLYCQPYDNSAIFQNAICCRCAIMTYPHSYYTKQYDNGNIIWEKGVEDMRRVFEQIVDGRINLKELQIASKQFAEQYLDYRKLAAKLYEKN